MDRRRFLINGAAIAAALCVPPQKANAAAIVSAAHAQPAAPQWLTGYGAADGSYGIALIDNHLDVTLLMSVENRLHKVIARPNHLDFCAPARGPEITMTIWRAEQMPLTVKAAKGQHFFGHAVYSHSGDTLYVTGNDYDAGTGIITMFDATNAYEPSGTISPIGIGPHDIHLHADPDILVIAIGGLLTHPATGRAVLNLETILSAILLIDRHSGRVLDKAVLPSEQQGLSLRHIDVSTDGQVLIGAQDQYRDNDRQSLVGLWTPGSPIKMLPLVDEAMWAAFEGYIGSVSFDRSGNYIAAASPRGGLIGVWDRNGPHLIATHPMKDVCGLAPTDQDGGFLVTSGSGAACLMQVADNQLRTTAQRHTALRFDNHSQLI